MRFCRRVVQRKTDPPTPLTGGGRHTHSLGVVSILMVIVYNSYIV
jgi:hypothetical protein